MFSSLGLFQTLQCPDNDNCRRTQCIFSHRLDLPPPRQTQILLREPSSVESRISALKSQSTSQTVHVTRSPAATGTKRAAPVTPPLAGTSNGSPAGEPPRKLQKLNNAERSIAVPSATYTSVITLVSVNILELA
jgi:RNA exonuclease 1